MYAIAVMKAGNITNSPAALTAAVKNEIRQLTTEVADLQQYSATAPESNRQTGKHATTVSLSNSGLQIGLTTQLIKAAARLLVRLCIVSCRLADSAAHLHLVSISQSG